MVLVLVLLPLLQRTLHLEADPPCCSIITNMRADL
jgi:hypothetical protein